jgi:hypothetical protein
MTTSFPTGLDALTNPTAGDSLSSPSHSAQHANANDAIEALQAKVGVDGSAVTTSLDYKISQAATLTGTETLTNKTLTNPTIATPEEPFYNCNFFDWSSNVVNISVLNASIQRPNVVLGPANNFIVNLRGDSTTTLASILPVSSSITIALYMTYGTDVSYYPTGFRIDGTTYTVLWPGGAPTSGLSTTDVSGIVSYVVFRTGTSAYNVLGTFTKFKV